MFKLKNDKNSIFLLYYITILFSSVFIRQNSTVCSFKPNDSWTVLSSVEQHIRQKVEAIGTPLKDWEDIQINYGVKTGFNDAFIINGEKRKELIEQDSKSAEIIRPILRGRDIQRYGYKFADLWLINVHNGVKEKGITPVNIEDYPAIKRHLDRFYPELEKRQDKGNTAYNLRNCAYIEDFYKQKIIYPDIMRMPRNIEQLKEYPYVYFDCDSFYIEATNFMITGENIEAIYLFLVSDLGFFAFSKFYSGPQFDTTGFRYKKVYLNETYIPIPDESTRICFQSLIKKLHTEKNIDAEINKIWFDLIGLNEEEMKYICQYKKNLLEYSSIVENEM